MDFNGNPRDTLGLSWNSSYLLHFPGPQDKTYPHLVVTFGDFLCMPNDLGIAILEISLTFMALHGPLGSIVSISLFPNFEK